MKIIIALNIRFMLYCIDASQEKTDPSSNAILFSFESDDKVCNNSIIINNIYTRLCNSLQI